MGAKDISVKPIKSEIARAFIKEHHYSGKFVNNSSLHFGAFLGNELHGVMSFGASMDKGRLRGLVTGTDLNGFLELNRMAFDEFLPRNSESRCIAVAMKLIKKNCPHIKWVVSFADATQCGDGQIYRASGFVLTGIKKNGNLARLPSGEVVHKLSLETVPNAPRRELGGRSYFAVTGGKYSFHKYLAASGAKVLTGFQLRYIYFIDPEQRENLTVPEIPFSRIKEMGIQMYKGKRPSSIDNDAATNQVEKGGANPTDGLHFTENSKT